MFNKKNNLLFFSYIIISIFLLLYSYTQIDLNLTLSRVGFLQSIQKNFQQIGFYQRPLSTAIYLCILVLLFVGYAYALKLTRTKQLSTKALWQIILVVTLILIPAYPAFSYDFFNYLFTAKSVLIYHKNPYLVIPREFWGIDPWVNFMRWIHLPSAYTPLWISLTLLPFLFGFGYLVLTILSTKAMVAGFYLLAVLGLQKIARKLFPNSETVVMATFALNPLIMIETLVSGHNDIAMMAIAIWAIYFYLLKKSWWSFFALSVSIAVKLMTIFLVPVFFLRWNRKVALLAVFLGLVLVLTQREILGWYWVWIVPFVAILPEFRGLSIISSAVSLGLLLRYAPYLYLGHWDAPVPVWKVWLTIIPILGSFVYLKFSRRH